MGRPTNHLLVIFALVLYLFCCPPLTGGAADNSVSTKHDDGRKELASFSDVSAAAAMDSLDSNGPFEEIKKLYDGIDAGDKAREFTLDITATKKDEPWILPPSPPSEPWILPPPPPSEPRKLPPPPPSEPSPSHASPPPPSEPSPSHASPLSHVADTVLMMISTTITIVVIFIMY